MTCNKMYRPLGQVAKLLLIASMSLLETACGGGGSTSSSATPNMPMTPVASVSPLTVNNTQNLIIDAGPANTVNSLFTSVTICQPGSATACQTIDHILVDTGSVGLRLLSSIVQPSLELTQNLASNGSALVECTQFADGFSWGPIKSSDVRLAGQTASAVPIQIIGDSAFPSIPAACSASGPQENTVRDFGANGILGIGNFTNDCGNSCATSTTYGLYYACDATGCAPTTASATQQVQHPVTLLATNNNGVVLRLPQIAEPGAASAIGTMILGIGTQSNNALGTAKVYTVDPFNGTFTITLGGKAYPGSFIDSGSNAYFFPSTTTLCSSGFYCPPSTVTFNTVIQGKNGTNAIYNFNVANADDLFNRFPNFTALPALGGFFDNTTVDLGLPFYFGRSVFTAIEGKSTPGGTGPYVAF
ncbi:MAG: DUF3443 domain-containing protein [Herminiimonas sp.]|nr:DUF3443 domain-containing protein [Herminiimonas sp.]